MSTQTAGSVSQLVLIPSTDQLKEILKPLIFEAIANHFSQMQEDADKAKPVLVYRSRKYVKDLLNTSYPTLKKYTHKGLIKGVYFGRRILYPDHELRLALPGLRTIMDKADKNAA